MTDAQMISEPRSWPKWPALPLVKRERGQGLGCGMLFAQASPPFVVFVDVNLFTLFEVEGKTWEAKLSRFERREYATAEELLSEWRID